MSSAPPHENRRGASQLCCYRIDPMQDTRWAELVADHPGASVFHSLKWLDALRVTYGFQPVAFTTSPPGEPLKNGLVFCNVNSWLTGRRLVSLPFSDHCEPLLDSADDLNFLLRYLQTSSYRDQFKYIEIRPVTGSSEKTSSETEFQSAQKYILHRLNLAPGKDELFRTFDKDSIQRRIRRAERAGLVEECGQSSKLLSDFYGLLVMTRSRHHVPPQPFGWFQNLANSFGEDLKVRLVYQGHNPVASILTLRFRDTVYYKYGCSDGRFNNLGGMPFLLWRAIDDAKSTNSRIFDLGRSDEDNLGLIAFKSKWGAVSQPLVYLRFPGSLGQTEWKMRVMKQFFACMPHRLLKAAGNLIYRHIG